MVSDGTSNKSTVIDIGTFRTSPYYPSVVVRIIYVLHMKAFYRRNPVVRFVAGHTKRNSNPRIHVIHCDLGKCEISKL